jgi:hypothetical protein
MKLTITLDVDEYPTIDEYRQFAVALPAGARLVDVVEVESSVDITAELSAEGL